MKLTYWIAECLDDNYVYSIRAQTRKAVKAELDSRGLVLRKAGTFGHIDAHYGADSEYAGKYGVPQKVTVEYASAFELLLLSLSEDHPA